MTSTDFSARRANFEKFLFAPANPRTVGILRIALAALLFAAVFSDYEGWKLSGRLNYPEIRYYFENVFFTEPYRWLGVSLLGLFALGIVPRALGWILLITLAPLALNIAKSPTPYIALSLLLGFVWLRSDVRYSLPAVLFGARAEPVGPVWPIRLMQFMVSLIYGVNAIAKTTPAYLSGDVLAALATLPNWLMDFSDGRAHFGSVAVPLAVVAPASVLSEWILAVGFWFRRWRLWVALFGLAFHYALTFVVQIGNLDTTIILLYLLFFIPIEEKPDSEVR